MGINAIMFSSVFIDDEVSSHLDDMCKTRKNAVYIPAHTEFTPFNDRLYCEMGFEKATRFDIGYDFDPKKMPDLFNADLIHIGGGNTFLLRYLLEKRKLLGVLKDYATEKGVLIGNSAGSIVMCEDIYIANIADTNFIKDSNYKGIGLVNFEFKPHFQAYKNDIKYFELYSEIKKTTVYGVDEDSAIVIKNDQIIPIGNVVEINAQNKGGIYYEL